MVSATAGSFDGTTLTLRDVPPPLIFSDRPYRVWGHMTLSELLPRVEEGPNSFIENPPNAVLSTFREGELPTEATVVMHRPALDGANLSFSVDILDGSIPATFGPASLFVDGIHHHGHAGAFIVGAAVGNAAAENDTETVVVKEPHVRLSRRSSSRRRLCAGFGAEPARGGQAPVRPGADLRGRVRAEARADPRGDVTARNAHECLERVVSRLLVLASTVVGTDKLITKSARTLGNSSFKVLWQIPKTQRRAV